jgi:hypothetical protein
MSTQRDITPQGASPMEQNETRLLVFALWDCYSACNIDPLRGVIGFQS